MLQINVKDLNFRKYKEVSDLENDENHDLFPPRFVVDVIREDGDRSSKLHVQCKISCYGKNDNVIFDNLFFTINIPSKLLQEDASSNRSEYVYNSMVVTQKVT